MATSVLVLSDIDENGPLKKLFKKSQIEVLQEFRFTTNALGRYFGKMAAKVPEFSDYTNLVLVISINTNPIYYRIQSINPTPWAQNKHKP